MIYNNYIFKLIIVGSYMQKITKGSNVLRFNNPASSSASWDEALPIGNGKMGVLIQGGVQSERIMITDYRAVWKGSVGVLPDITDKLKDVRGFVKSKNPIMAGVTLEKSFRAKKYEPSKFTSVPIADLVVNQQLHGKASGYARILDLNSEEARVLFNANQSKFLRTGFVSFSDDCFYYELSKTGNAPIDVELYMTAHDRTTAVYNNVYSGMVDNENTTLSGALIGYEFEAGGMTYGALARVFVDSKAVCQLTEKTLKIENADRILLVVKTYVGKAKEKRIEKIKHELLSLRQVSYEKAIKQHLSEYVKKASPVELSISKERDCSVEEMIAGFDEDSTLIYEKLFNFSKYLINTCLPISFSTPLVTGLIGKHYNNECAVAETSTSLTALYSPLFNLGQEDKVYEVLKYFETYQDDLKKNAYRIYKSKGFMVPSFFVAGSGLPASIQANDISVVTGGAVIANLFYEYFLYTKDMRFLKNEALPFMTAVADFYMNYFYKNEKGEVVSCPSFSPFGKSKYFETKNVGVYENSTCDFVVVRSLFNNIMNVANIYSVNVEKIVEYQNFLNELPLPSLENNGIREFKNEENSVLSSGILHLYNSFATKEVQHNSNIATLTPLLNSLIYKIDKAIFSQNLTALGRLAEMSAVVGQSGSAYGIIKYMINNFMGNNCIFLNSDKKNSGGYVNGDNYFNLTGNMLLCSTVIESLVLDYQNNISIMPAKPEVWKEGRISNVFTKQNVIVDVAFDDKRGNLTVSLKATKTTKFNVILPRGVKKVKNFVIDVTSPRLDNITLLAGKSLVLEIKY